MCGFFGYTSSSRKFDSIDTDAVTSVLFSRGPDQQKVVTFADTNTLLLHCRLSILDGSDLGAQPMYSRNGRFCIIFNGEIYNYEELRAEFPDGGRGLRGRSDTEILVNFFEVFGISDTLDRITGIYSIVLYDVTDHKIYLIRDPVGVKPLYYYSDRESLYFSSISTPIRTAIGSPLDPRSFGVYIKYGYLPRYTSIFSEIRKLEPGSVLTYDIGSRTITQVRAFSKIDVPPPAVIQGSSSYLDEFDVVLGVAVRDQVKADVKVGLALSGGVDSTLLAHYVSECASDIAAYTLCMGDKPNSELETARNTAQRMGIQHRAVFVDRDEVIRGFLHISSVIDEPLGDPSIVPAYLLGKAMSSDRVRVAISGDGADELFGGYPWYRSIERYHSVGKALKRAGLLSILSAALLPLETIVARAKRALDLYGAQDLSVVHQMIRSRVIRLSDLTAELEVDRGLGYKATDLSGLLRNDQRSYLVDDILFKLDRAFMASSIEARVPFLDQRVISYLHRVDFAAKVGALGSKRLLVELLTRKSNVGVNSTGVKQGFTVDFDSIMRNELRRPIDNLMRRIDPCEDLLDRESAYTLWNNFQKGSFRDNGIVFALVSFLTWKYGLEYKL